ncbi:MAG: hypothetical protein ACI4D5_02195 [Kineothrix sp.]
MKKKMFLVMTIMAVNGGVMAGCSAAAPQETVSEEALQTEEGGTQSEPAAGTEENAAETDGQVSTVTGVMEEVKDFMFILTDENQVSYAFSFEEKPEGLEEVSAGDSVTVTYTGTISEIDPFVGEVLSVKKQP